MIIDTHAHLEIIDDLENSLKRAKDAGVGKIITIGTSLESSKKAIEIAQKFSRDDLQIFATCGIHPKDGKDEVEKFSLDRCIDTLKQLIGSSSKVVGVGEAGLDYRLTADPSTHSVNSVQASSGQAKPVTTDEEKEFQRKLFTEQIKLAGELNLPLIIHCRNAWDEIFEHLDNKRGQSSFGVFHSWTGDWNSAQKALNLGFYISFSGIVTFKQSLRSSSFGELRTAGLKNALDIQEVAKKMPLEQILIETDSPFLSPEPLRGKTNEPKNVRIIAEFLAHLRSQPIDKIIGVSADNAKRLFGI